MLLTLLLLSHVPLLTAAPTKTMITVWSTGMYAFQTTTIAVESWDDCVDYCFSDDNCLMVTAKVGSSRCVVYNYGDVHNFNKGDSSSNRRVSVKVFTETCGAKADDVFDGVVFNSFVQSVFSTYRIESVNNTFQFFYVSNLPIDNCNDWLLMTPQCDSGCTETMLFIGASLEDYFLRPTSTIQTISWKECMASCWLDDNCFIAMMLANESMCNLYKIGTNIMAIRGDISSKFSIKIPFSSTTCSFDYFEALRAHRYKFQKPLPHTDFQIRSSTVLLQYFSVMWIEKGTPETMINATSLSPGNLQFYIDYSNVPYLNSVVYCTARGDGVMPVVNQNALNAMVDGLDYDRPNASIGLLIGSSGKWQWTLPNLVEDPTNFFWAPGYPKEGHDCGIIDKTVGPVVISTMCTDVADNMICHVEVLPEE